MFVLLRFSRAGYECNLRTPRTLPDGGVAANHG